MNQYWITSFVQTKLNGGGDWQAYGKEMPLESERTLDKFYEPDQLKINYYSVYHIAQKLMLLKVGLINLSIIFNYQIMPLLTNN